MQQKDGQASVVKTNAQHSRECTKTRVCSSIISQCPIKMAEWIKLAFGRGYLWLIIDQTMHTLTTA